MLSNAAIIQETCTDLQKYLEDTSPSQLSYARLAKAIGYIHGLAYEYLSHEERESALRMADTIQSILEEQREEDKLEHMKDMGVEGV